MHDAMAVGPRILHPNLGGVDLPKWPTTWLFGVRPIMPSAGSFGATRIKASTHALLRSSECTPMSSDAAPNDIELSERTIVECSRTAHVLLPNHSAVALKTLTYLSQTALIMLTKSSRIHLHSLSNFL